MAIITKDTGLRVRALSWQCLAENYRSDLLEDVMYTGIREVVVNNNNDWNILWQAKDNMLEIKSLPEYIQDGVANTGTTCVRRCTRKTS